MRFERRNVLVTGGASGIGLAITTELIAEVRGSWSPIVTARASTRCRRGSAIPSGSS